MVDMNLLGSLFSNGTSVLPMAMIMTFLAIALVVGLIMYVYSALVYMTLSKKLKRGPAWLAWIPIANIFLIPILAKKNWVWGFIMLVPIVNLIFFIYWTWIIFEDRKYPGWLSLMPLLGFIPVIGFLAGIGYLITLGIVAWVDRK